MFEITTQLIHTPEITVPLGLTSLGILVAVVSIVSHQWSKVRRAELDATLKHRMLEQGMSADDIKKVLEASSRPPHGCGKSARLGETSDYRT